MAHRWLPDPDLPPDAPAGGAYETGELEEKLRSDFGGDLWRVWHVGASVPGAGLAAGYTRNDSGRYVLSAVILVGDALTSELLRKVPVAALENSINIGQSTVREDVDKLPPLRRTPEMSPEDFSRLVAEHYRAWSRAVPHPAGAMAADSDVTVGTVHNWIREARIRGFLPPARRGKADLGDRFAQRREFEKAQAALSTRKAAVEEDHERLKQAIAEAGGEYIEAPPPPREEP